MATHEKEVYKKSYAITKDIYRKYGHNIDKILESGCYEIIFALIDNNIIDPFIDFYMMRCHSMLMTGGIELTKTNLRNIHAFNKTHIDMFIEKYLPNIRVKLTFIHEGFYFLHEKLEPLQKIINSFKTCARYRVKKTDYRNEICLTGFNHKTLPVPETYDEKEFDDRNMDKCAKMLPPFEKYTKYEKLLYKFINMQFRPGVNIFSAPDNLNKKDQGAFVAGISGHTISIIVFYAIFIIDIRKKENDLILKYLVMGCMIWMISYYHHSLREILFNLLLFTDDNENELAKQTLELFKKCYNDKTCDTKKYNKLMEILEDIPLDIDEVWDDNIGPKFSASDVDDQTSYLKYISDKIDKVREKIEEFSKDKDIVMVLPPASECVKSGL